MRKSRFQAKLKATRLSINGLKPLRYFPSILEERINLKQLVEIKRYTPKTKKTKKIRRMLANMIFGTKRLLGIKKDPNRCARYSQFTSFDSKEELWKYLKHQVEWELIRAIATERWKDHDRRVDSKQS